MKRFAPLIAVAFVSLIVPAFGEMNIDVVVDGLNNPWEMVFAPNGDIYFSERDGRVWKIENFGEAKVIQTFPKSGSYEGGTLGLALDPNFEENKKIYIYQTNLELEFFQNKVFSFTVDGDELVDVQTVIDDIPGAPWHDGGRIAFGPDDKLYITTGDAVNPGWSQDLSSLAGKILRINSDGSIPDDNPFDSEYFTNIEHADGRDEPLREDTPCIVIATSGMLEGGPVLEYFRNFAPNPKNKILFVSYQVNGTLGRRVMDGARQVTIMGRDGKVEVVTINCGTEKLEGFSGHSDYNQLMSYVQRLRPKLRRVLVNHGERRKSQNLSSAINRMYRVTTHYPQVQEAIKLF